MFHRLTDEALTLLTGLLEVLGYISVTENRSSYPAELSARVSIGDNQCFVSYCIY